MRLIICVLAAAFFLFECGPAHRSVRRAERQIEKGRLERAREYYQIALNNNLDHYAANLGMAVIYSEWMDNYAAALPYFERAYKNSKRDTSYDLLIGLARCYQRRGDFDKALSFYSRLNGVVDYEGENDVQKELKRNKASCLYSRQHSKDSLNSSAIVMNIGPSVNSDMPEYVPVVTRDNELLFTSKRKDNPGEEVDYMDGKYHEAMYIAKIVPDGYSNVQRYTTGERTRRKLVNSSESVVSLSQDGRRLFTFRNGRVYELPLKDTNNVKAERVLKNLGRRSFQSHVFLTADGKTLYFTTDMSDGFGGRDIYLSRLQADGNWSVPENLGPEVNTNFDEEAPFLSMDGKTLYFSSKGHEGFGNFDIFSSQMVNGKWAKVTNLGPPFNSPAEDIFFETDSTGQSGYFASDREGGFGDMDIYSFFDLAKVNGPCVPSEQIPLQVSDSLSTGLCRWEILTPTGYKLRKVRWFLDGKPLVGTGRVIRHSLDRSLSHVLEARALLVKEGNSRPVTTCIKRSVPAMGGSSLFLKQRGGIQPLQMQPPSSLSLALSRTGH